ncbi:MAG: M28 family peptidase [Longimicrobiales bacterium]
MSARWSFFLVLLFLSGVPLGAQGTPEHRFDAAWLAWDEGHYLEALQGLESLLQDPDAAFLQDDIARLTGEVYRVSEISSDGAAVRWSPDGRYAAYESGSGGERVTHVLRLGGEGLEEVARLNGSGLVFSPDGGRVARLVLEEGDALEAARARLREEIAPTDRASFSRFRTELADLESRFTRIVVRDLDGGAERTLRPESVGVLNLLYPPTGRDLFFLGVPAQDPESSQIFRVSEEGAVEPLTREAGRVEAPFFGAGGRVLVYGREGGSFGVLTLTTGDLRIVPGTNPVMSADGSTLAFFLKSDTGPAVGVLPLTDPSGDPTVVARSEFPLATATSRACSSCPALTGLALSPDGSRVVFQGMPREDWELFEVSVGEGNGEPANLTREIQHDLFPRFLSTGPLLTVKGEGRHRRSFLYDLRTGEGTRLFRNNTLRTVAPEYEWAPSPDGTKLLIVAERDGNTVSPERGVYLLELDRKVSREDLLDRVRWNLSAERALREKAQRMFGPLAGEIRGVVSRVSVPRLYEYESALFRFGSKHITRPGNALAIDYLVKTLRAFGYEPELQWFEPRGTRTANVVVRIPGSLSPEVVYAVSAHFDSNQRSPGADDNTSATVGLLEMARILADSPLPATVEIAFFTGEEAGLLGSREYVRRAVESGTKLVGALNNDMVGWAENHRLDNTVRYSNDGIRDVQHGAAILFSDLITYDARYYKSTDAAAYYDAYGDIVGGIGSYPILASPHYHQVHDVLETVNHRLIAEVAKVTVASTMLLASSPSRLTGLTAEGTGTGTSVRWHPAVEADVTRYVVVYGPEGNPEAKTVTVSEPRVDLADAGPGTVIAVKAVNGTGLEGWDWARIRVGG